MQQRRANDTRHDPEEVTTKESRQAVTGHKVRYVLFTSVALTVAAFIVIYAVFA